jgi:hypothetical protein
MTYDQADIDLLVKQAKTCRQALRKIQRELDTGSIKDYGVLSKIVTQALQKYDQLEQSANEEEETD